MNKIQGLRSQMRIDILTYNIHGLPWARDHIESICNFLLEKMPPIICLQEVFLDRSRAFYKDFLEYLGYTVLIPRDDNVTLLPSGLLTAFKKTEFTVLSDCFCCFQDVHNVEWFANKGFHVARVIHRASRNVVSIVNTHTQSDTEVSWIFGRRIIAEIRKKQAMQMYTFLSVQKEPILITGDLNCETEPYEGLRFLHPPGCRPLKKRTFYSTGEDLDHIAALTDRPLPHVTRCRIYDRPWSDHAPVVFSVQIQDSR
jgi:exonuclease III